MTFVRVFSLVNSVVSLMFYLSHSKKPKGIITVSHP